MNQYVLQFLLNESQYWVLWGSLLLIIVVLTWLGATILAKKDRP